MRKLKNYHSTSVHNDAGGIHIRRLARNPETGFLTDNFKPVYNRFLEQLKAVEEKIRMRINANDDVDYCDTLQDNEVKTSSFETKAYDIRSNSTPVYGTIFPNGGYGSIVRMNKMEEVGEVEALAGRFENLGAEHQLYPFAESLRSYAAESKTAIDRYKKADDEVKKAEAALEVAKDNLRKAYLENYLLAYTKLGESKAESFFTKEL